MNITPELKDKLISYFKQVNSITFAFYPSEVSKHLDMQADIIKVIFDQIVSKGLIKRDSISSSGSCLITLKADFFDFVRHGGFTAQEELLEANLKKLLLEIDTLKKELSPNLLEKANKIASIAGGISSALGLFIK